MRAESEQGAVVNQRGLHRNGSERDVGGAAACAGSLCRSAEGRSGIFDAGGFRRASRGHVLWPLLWLPMLALLLLLALASAWHEASHWLDRPLSSVDAAGPDQDGANVAATALAPIPPVIWAAGESLTVLERHLVAAGLLGRPGAEVWRFRLYVALSGQGRALQAGEYAFPPGVTPRQLLRILRAGEVVRHRLTIAEGLRADQALALIRADARLRQDLPATEADLAAALELPELEGWIQPETYVFALGQSALALVRQAVQQQRQALEAAWERRSPELPLRSPEEVLVLASIVEKETALAEERARIAGVFVNRLRAGMRLQTDPTVIYGVLRTQEDFDGNLTRAHLRTDTPWNTYTRAGLPPTPIALPGAAAIEAVIAPEATDALFFVARGDGSHAFSSSLAAHNAAVARYQRGEPAPLPSD